MLGEKLILLGLMLMPELNNALAVTMAQKSNGTKPKTVLGKCTRCRLMVNSMFELIKSSSVSQDTGEFPKIWDKLCFNIKAGRDDCRSFAEDNFEAIKSWWATKSTDPDEAPLLNNVCINILQVCCPDGHYGPECLPCSGYPDKICSNHGKCAGMGTRTGNGHCICNHGYAGPNCETCDRQYYMDPNSQECIACDESCSGSCFDSGPKGCHVCKKGYAWVADSGCTDVDECLAEFQPNPCPANSFCINTDGSYQCYECDPACDGCEGDGPDSCLKCAKDHIIKDGVCVNPNPKPLIPTPEASPARYATYFGLCLVTCIIFRHNIWVASTIGLAVALYIMASERSLDTEYGRAFDNWWTNLFI